MQFSKEELAKSCYEAIKKIARNVERRCPKCEGVGKVIRYAPQEVVSQVVCSTCNGTGKVKGKWKWEPEKWELVIYKGEVDVITGHSKSPIHIHLSSVPGICTKELIPLLHWERIEQILEGMGYYMSLPTKGERSDLWVVGFSSFNFKGTNKEFRYYKNTYVGRGQTRQEAVQRAVIELGKES